MAVWTGRPARPPPGPAAERPGPRRPPPARQREGPPGRPRRKSATTAGRAGAPPPRRARPATPPSAALAGTRQGLLAIPGPETGEPPGASGATGSGSGLSGGIVPKRETRLLAACPRSRRKSATRPGPWNQGSIGPIISRGRPESVKGGGRHGMTAATGCPGLSKVLRLGHCLNQDLQDLRIFKIEFPNPVNPFILIILIQTELWKSPARAPGALAPGRTQRYTGNILNSLEEVNGRQSPD